MYYRFPAVFEPAASGGFGVYFPDLPGCTSAGDDLEQAAENAAEALSFHLEGMDEDKEVIPLPTPAQKAMIDAAQEGEGRVVMLVSAEGPENAERVNVYLPKNLLERIDRYVAGRPEMKGRSAFLLRAANRYLGGPREAAGQS